MKIETQNRMMNGKVDTGGAQSARKVQEVSKTVAKFSDYDKLTIGQTRFPQMPDSQFISTLKKSILADIQAGAPEHKLSDLAQQVALGQYEINPAEIVRKMMLDNCEVTHE